MTDKTEFTDPAYAAHKFATDPTYRARCEAQAREWAKANKTDPFAYGRAMTRYRNGIAYAGHGDALFNGSESYGVSWSQEIRTYESDGHCVEYAVPVPINMKTP